MRAQFAIFDAYHAYDTQDKRDKVMARGATMQVATLASRLRLDGFR